MPSQPVSGTTLAPVLPHAAPPSGPGPARPGPGADGGGRPFWSLIGIGRGSGGTRGAGGGEPFEDEERQRRETRPAVPSAVERARPEAPCSPQGEVRGPDAGAALERVAAEIVRGAAILEASSQITLRLQVSTPAFPLLGLDLSLEAGRVRADFRVPDVGQAGRLRGALGALHLALRNRGLVVAALRVEVAPAPPEPAASDRARSSARPGRARSSARPGRARRAAERGGRAARASGFMA